jgi:hypothetical protein
MRSLAVALFFVCFSTACSGKDDESDSDSECTSLRPDGPIVAQGIHYGASPAPATGGEIPEGSFSLSGASVYVPANSLVLLNCNALSGALELHGGSFETALGCYFDADDPNSFLEGNLNGGTYATSGTSLTMTSSCVRDLVETFPYSVDSPTTLRVLVPIQGDDISGTTELVWTLSP